MFTEAEVIISNGLTSYDSPLVMKSSFKSRIRSIDEGSKVLSPFLTSLTSFLNCLKNKRTRFCRAVVRNFNRWVQVPFPAPLLTKFRRNFLNCKTSLRNQWVQLDISQNRRLTHSNVGLVLFKSAT